MPLSETRRQQLDGIVHQMTNNREKESDIQFVVNDFKGKYENEALPKLKMANAGGGTDGSSEPKPQGIISKVGGALKNVAVGAVKGAISAPYEAAQAGGAIGSYAADKLGRPLVQKIIGKNKMPLSAAAAAIQQGVKQGADAPEALSPVGTAQKVGFGAEKAAEFFAPGGLVNKGAKALKEATVVSKLPKLLKPAVSLAGRVGLEGAAMAGVTTAQGGSAKDAAENAAFGAGGVLAGKALGALGKKLAPVLQASAEKGYAQALGATTKENKAITQRIVPELLKRRVSSFSRPKLLSKIEKGIESAGRQMDTVLESIPKDAPVNLASVASDLEQAKQSFMVPGAGGRLVVADPQAVQHIEGFQNIIRDIGTKNAPYESVRKLRQIWDKSIAQSKGFYGKTVTEGSLLDAKKEAANALRGELAKQFPDMAKVNAEYSFWSNAQKVLSDTIERTQSQKRPLTETIRRSAGAIGGTMVGGPLGGVLGDVALGALSKIVDSTAWKTLGSIQKSSLAKQLATGDLEGFVKLISKIAASQNIK